MVIHFKNDICNYLKSTNQFAKPFAFALKNSPYKAFSRSEQKESKSRIMLYKGESPPLLHTAFSLFKACILCTALCYGHKSSTGTVRRLFLQKSYDSTAPVRRPAGGRKNRTIFYQFFRHRTVPGEV